MPVRPSADGEMRQTCMRRVEPHEERLPTGHRAVDELVGRIVYFRSTVGISRTGQRSGVLDPLAALPSDHAWITPRGRSFFLNSGSFG